MLNPLVYELNPENYKRVLKTKTLKFKENKTKSAKKKKILTFDCRY